MNKGIREVEAGLYILSFTLDSTVWNSTHLPSLELATALRSEILMRSVWWANVDQLNQQQIIKDLNQCQRQVLKAWSYLT
tara:strand:+ start:741 stop:980 length:240 start_codon:yes stop_codon:yes gene_type:complete